MMKMMKMTMGMMTTHFFSLCVNFTPIVAILPLGLRLKSRPVLKSGQCPGTVIIMRITYICDDHHENYISDDHDENHIIDDHDENYISDQDYTCLGQTGWPR